IRPCATSASRSAARTPLSALLAILIAYAALMVLIGAVVGRRVETTEGFFVAKRALGPGLLFATLLAANIGAGSTIAAAGIGYTNGLAAWWWVGSAGIGSVVLALWLGTLAILAGQLIGLSTLLTAVIGTPTWLGCVLGGIVITVYFTAGGLTSSAWVNVLQLCVKLVGFALALPLALAHAGGWSAVVARLDVPNEYWSLWKSGTSGWMYLVLLAPALVVSPGLLQKVFGARDDHTVRLGTGLNALGLLAFAFVP